MPLQRWLESRWYSGQPPPFWLRPLAWLYGVIARGRRARLTAKAQRLPVPVIVVGNLSVGGTGKTPFTVWLVQRLREWGYTPGVISRGYGGHAPQYPMAVTADSDPAHCGDEPLLLARRLGVPLAVDPDRAAAGRLLLQHDPQIDVLVADDGLQHYRLARDLEICVVDGARGLGNGALLPAGPLREPPQRLREIPLCVVNGGGWRAAGVACSDMALAMAEYRRFDGTRAALGTLAGQRVHAVAGIGHPPRFFAQLRAQGLTVIEHPFPDHHAYVAGDLAFGDDLPVLMTEKDAVKCAAIAPPHWAWVPVDAVIDDAGIAAVRKLCEQRLKPPHHG
ncbi:MAG: tetraacyldisaccharide 4'-kinase [Nevskiaceae bacterium]|nr:MAG: tetraacyldisaccharide 4'-kinase [Nevskiaceae bacterium]